MKWQPTADINTLKARAKLMNQLRAFFAERDIYEVETPLLGTGSVPSPYIESFVVNNKYLQTSPEFAMKRLLAAGSGSIYQICKAFRQEEAGKLHNPEFTMLEWYRVDKDYKQLMQEVGELLCLLLDCNDYDTMTYHEAFKQHLNINPHAASFAELHKLVNSIEADINLDTQDDCLNFLMTHMIEPTLGQDKPCFIYDYPASQSALACIREAEWPVAERFEGYYQGIELANGFQELGNADEQRERFDAELQQRKAQQQALIATDERFLQSLDHLPRCAGVAVGLDRLLMLALGKTKIAEVMSFTFDVA